MTEFNIKESAYRIKIPRIRRSKKSPRQQFFGSLKILAPTFQEAKI